MRLLKASMSMFFLLMAEVSLCHTTSIVSYPGINRGNLFSYSARLSCSRVYPISGNTQSVSAIAGSLSHIVYGLQDPHSSWPTSFGSIIINSLLFQEIHCRINISMQTLFLFILGPIVLGLIRNPIWQDSGELASSFNYQSADPAF